jgi:L-fuculose-phosphate aldolase
MVDIGRRMYDRGYIAGCDGNLSVRLGEHHVLTTPAGAPKGFLETSDLVVTDLEGQQINRGDSRHRPSSELQVHLAAYRVRGDISAVVHAHPKAAVAHSLAGISLDDTVIPETVFTLGTIAGAEYETPGTRDLADRLERTLRCHDAIVMERHGTLTLGSDLLQAYLRLESLEHTAQILLMARTLGSIQPLPSGEVENLYHLAEQAGVRWPFRTDPSCRGPVCTTDNQGSSSAISDDLVGELARQVLERLRAG